VQERTGAELARALDGAAISAAKSRNQRRAAAALVLYLAALGREVPQLPIFREVRDGYLSNDTLPPPSTVVQVVAVAREGLMIEVEVVAVLPPSA
jgi:enamine deaminase RidA (YjgF/YER057c/UK114 family)